MKFKSSYLLTVLLAIFTLSSIAKDIAIVNGQGIPSSYVDILVKQFSPQDNQTNLELRNIIKEELINRKVLVQEANKLGLYNNADIQLQTDIARQSVLIHALMTNFVKKNTVKDAEIITEYEKFKANAIQKEYHVLHILSDSENDARSIIVKLKEGANFQDLAKDISKDPGSSTNGGDLGWISLSSFVRPFSDALVSLKPGQLTEIPVHTRFGYHVIKLKEIRQVKVPKIEEIRPQITEKIRQKNLQIYRKNLYAKAKIEYLS